MSTEFAVLWIAGALFLQMLANHGVAMRVRSLEVKLAVLESRLNGDI